MGASDCWACFGFLVGRSRHEQGDRRAERSRLDTGSRREEASLSLRTILASRILGSGAGGRVGDDRGQFCAEPPTPGLGGWRPGAPHDFKLRCGPDYRRNGFKHAAGAPFFHCIGADVFRGEGHVKCALAHWCPVVSMDSDARLGKQTVERAAHCELPRVMLFNFQLPLEPGPFYGQHPKDDVGCNVLLWFAVREDYRVSQDFAPGARSLLSTYFSELGHPFREGTHVSRCLKIVGLIDGIESLNIPAPIMPLVRKFNGKPVLIEKESRRFSSTDGKIVELAVDVRGFNPLARHMLYRLRAQLVHCTVKIGLVIQGCSDEELPEQFMGIVELDHMNFEGARLAAASADSELDHTHLGRGHDDLCGVQKVVSMSISALKRFARRCGPRRRQLAHLDTDEEGLHWATPKSHDSNEQKEYGRAGWYLIP